MEKLFGGGGGGHNIRFYERREGNLCKVACLVSSCNWRKGSLSPRVSLSKFYVIYTHYWAYTDTHTHQRTDNCVHTHTHTLWQLPFGCLSLASRRERERERERLTEYEGGRGILWRETTKPAHTQTPYMQRCQVKIWQICVFKSRNHVLYCISNLETKFG